MPAMFGADGPTAYGLGLLLGAPTGILFAKSVNDARPVSVGQATAISWGGWWGWWTALGVSGMTDADADTEVWRNMTIGMVGGTAVGLVLARRPITAGDASLVAHASFWGTWYGAAVGLLADTDDGWPYLVVGGNAALLVAAIATKNVEVSSGRVWVSTAAGFAGLIAGLGIDLIAQTEDKTAILIPTVTSLVGLSIGLSATKNMDVTRVGLGGPAPAPALLGLREGRLQLGLPTPTPALVPRNDGARYRLVPGMRFTLFEMRH